MPTVLWIDCPICGGNAKYIKEIPATKISDTNTTVSQYLCENCDNYIYW